MILVKWVGPNYSGPLRIQMRVAGNGAKDIDDTRRTVNAGH